MGSGSVYEHVVGSKQDGISPCPPHTTSVMSEELGQLRTILVRAVDSILEVCTARGIDFPSLDKPADASEYAKDGIRNDPKVADAISLGVAAAAQLIATLQPPAMTLYSSAARVCFLGTKERTLAEILLSSTYLRA